MYTGNPLTDTLASSVDQDEMPHIRTCTVCKEKNILVLKYIYRAPDKLSGQLDINTSIVYLQK